MRFEFREGARGDETQWEPQKAQKHKRGTTGDSQFKGEQGTTGDSQFKGEMGATKGTKTQKASRVQLATASSKIQKHERGTTGGNPFKGDPNKWRGGLLTSCLSPLTFLAVFAQRYKRGEGWPSRVLPLTSHLCYGRSDNTWEMRSISQSGCSVGVWGVLCFCTPWRMRTVVIPKVLAAAISSVSLSPTQRI